MIYICIFLASQEDNLGAGLLYHYQVTYIRSSLYQNTSQTS